MVKTTQEKEETTVKEGKKTRGKIDSFSRVRWNYMKKQHGLSDSQLVKLKEASCPAKFNNGAATLIRFFDPDVAKEKGVTIEDYESLNEQPGLILYEGYHVSGRGGEIIIEKKDGVGASLLDEKIKKGAISDVGVIIEKTAKQKWLGRIGNFMMMGGWLLIVAVVLGIVIAVSILSKGC